MSKKFYADENLYHYLILSWQEFREYTRKTKNLNKTETLLLEALYNLKTLGRSGQLSEIINISSAITRKFMKKALASKELTNHPQSKCLTEIANTILDHTKKETSPNLNYNEETESRYYYSLRHCRKLPKIDSDTVKSLRKIGRLCHKESEFHSIRSRKKKDTQKKRSLAEIRDNLVIVLNKLSSRGKSESLYSYVSKLMVVLCRHIAEEAGHFQNQNSNDFVFTPFLLFSKSNILGWFISQALERKITVIALLKKIEGGKIKLNFPNSKTKISKIAAYVLYNQYKYTHAKVIADIDAMERWIKGYLQVIYEDTRDAVSYTASTIGQGFVAATYNTLNFVRNVDPRKIPRFIMAMSLVPFYVGCVMATAEEQACNEGMQVVGAGTEPVCSEYGVAYRTNDNRIGANFFSIENEEILFASDLLYLEDDSSTNSHVTGATTHPETGDSYFTTNRHDFDSDSRVVRIHRIAKNGTVIGKKTVNPQSGSGVDSGGGKVDLGKDGRVWVVWYSSESGKYESYIKSFADNLENEGMQQNVFRAGVVRTDPRVVSVELKVGDYEKGSLFVISHGLDGSEYQVFGQNGTIDGGQVGWNGEEQRISTDKDPDHQFPDHDAPEVVPRTDGGYIAGYRSKSTQGTCVIHIKSFDAYGNVIKDDDFDTGLTDVVPEVSVAKVKNGLTRIVWTEDKAVKSFYIDKNGNRITDPFAIVSSDSTYRKPTILAIKAENGEVSGHILCAEMKDPVSGDRSIGVCYIPVSDDNGSHNSPNETASSPLVFIIVGVVTLGVGGVYVSCSYLCSAFLIALPCCAMFSLFSCVALCCPSVTGTVVGSVTTAKRSKKFFRLRSEEQKDFFRQELRESLLDQGIKKTGITRRKLLGGSFEMPEDIRIIKDKLEIVKLLSGGASGTVYRVKIGGAIYVAKNIEITNMVGFQDLKKGELESELKIFSSIKHANVATFYGIKISRDRKSVYLVLESEDYSLSSVLHIKKIPLSLTKKIYILRDALLGLNYLHSENLIHRDIKSANVVLRSVNDETPKAKVIDFGLSQKTAGEMPNLGWRGVGTPGYMAKEVRMMGEYSQASDVYAFGVMILEVFLGVLPREDTKFSEIEQPSSEVMPKEIYNIAKRCILDDYNERPDTEEILQVLEQVLTDLELKEDQDQDEKNEQKEIFL